MYFRANKHGESNNEDYIQIKLKELKTWVLFYHLLAVCSIGWPAHWLTQRAKKHSDWILTEYNVEVFRKRLDDHENL